MKHTVIVTLGFVAAFFACVVCLAGQSEPSVGDLIRLLGSDDFVVRDTAAQELLSRRDAEPFLEKAVQSTDAEVSRRARRILEQFDSRRRGEIYTAMRGYAKRVEVDKLVDAITAQLAAPEEQRSWALVFDVAEKLLDFERKEFGSAGFNARPNPNSVLPNPVAIGMAREEGFTALKLGNVISAPRIQGVGNPQRMLLRANEVDNVTPISRSVVICQGSVRTSLLTRTVVFANGSMNMLSGIVSSLVVCDGDVTASSIGGSFVIARGKVVASQTRNSTILCEDAVHIGKRLAGTTVISAKQIHAPAEPPDKACVCKENVANAVAPARFFEASHVGLELAQAIGGTRIAAVEANTRFKDASVHEGDLILEVQGVAPTSLDACRRLLRKAVAPNLPFKMRVRRAGTAIELKVSSQDQ